MTHPEPPHNDHDEQATLGSILLNREAMVAVAPWLAAAHFARERHALIYGAMLACHHARIPPDTRTVFEELRRRGQLDAIGGIEYLSELTDAVPTAYHVEHYARSVERTAVLRRLISAGGRVAAAGYDEARDLEETIAYAHQQLLDATRRASDSALVPLSLLVDRLYERLSDTDAGPPGTPTGLLDFDSLTGGLHPTDMVTLAARPGVGKTALALSFARAVADAQRPVLIFSLEMGRDQLMERLAAQAARVDLMSVRQGRLSAEQLAAVMMALGRLGGLPIHVDDTPAQPIQTMHNAALRFLAGQPDGIGLIVVDYLQLARAPHTENRVQEVGAISRGLKAMAKACACPVLALSQLNRAVEGRTSHVPLLSDLRESGDIEQDSDLVIFVHRPFLYDKESDAGLAELHIAKHRGGPLGVVPLRWDAAATRFSNLTYRSMS